VAEHWDTVAVVYGEGALPWADHRFVVAAVFLRRRDMATPPLRIYRVPRSVKHAAVEADFQRLLNHEGGRVDHGYVLRDIPEAREGLEFDRNNPAVLARRDALVGFGGVVSLADLYDFPSSVLLSTGRHLGAARCRLPGSER
jgi:hypothetical protein